MTSHDDKGPEDGLRTPHRDGPGLQGGFEKQPQVSSKEIRIRVKAKGRHQDADGCEDTGRAGLVVGVGRACRGLGESLEQLPCSDRENNSGRTHLPTPPTHHSSATGHCIPILVTHEFLLTQWLQAKLANSDECSSVSKCLRVEERDDETGGLRLPPAETWVLERRPQHILLSLLFPWERPPPSMAS